MTIHYGLGIMGCRPLDIDAQTETDALIKIARLAKVTVRDVRTSGDVIEASAAGELVALPEAEAAPFRGAVRKGGSRPASHFEYLDGFHVLVSGARLSGEVTLFEQIRIHVGPLAELSRVLRKLLKRDDIQPDRQEFHRELQDLCELAQKLRVPLNLGGS